ncbi:DUF6185 family protein [Streptomyces sp. NPDC053069]|uniref:DUF6185 family protein n=1 Tax=Streptomyces sp. NPDC053069 TaxID=3365695 RepID=UPI0037CD7867
MVMTRRWRLLSFLVLVACLWGCGTAGAAQRNAGADCHSDGLRGSTVHATLRLQQHKRAHPQVTSDFTVDVPRKWPLATHLTFSENSPEYRQAMRCLLRGDEAPGLRTEWHHDPTVKATAASVEVHYVAVDWITSDKTILVGPWQIVPQGKKWVFCLRPPTLRTTRWKDIEADLGGLNFNDVSEQASSTTENTLVWQNQLPEQVRGEVVLSQQRTLALFLSRSSWSTAGIAAWWVSASILLALAALRARRPETATAQGTAGQPSGAVVPQRPTGQAENSGPQGEASLPKTLLQWALLSAAVALTLRLLLSQQQLSNRWHALLCIPAGLALVFAARPWGRHAPPAAPGAVPDESARPEDVQRRQARAVVSAVCSVAGIGLLVVLAHDAFGLPEDLQPKTATALGRAGLVLLGLATMWLWLAAMAAWAWRFAREGGLLRGRWAARWERDPAQCVAAVGCLLAGVAVALLAWAWWVNEQRWLRISWLVERNDSADYSKSVNNVLAKFFFTDLTWLSAYSWVLTGIALLALLHFRNRPRQAHGRRRYERFSRGPDKSDLLLIVLMFVFFVQLRATNFVGASALYGVWLPLNIVSFYIVLAMGRRWSVMSQLGDRFCVQRLGTEKHRRELMAKAHEYRNVNHQMYLLNQGHAGAVTCEQLEDQLRRLRQWLVAACARGNPPEQISVLDVALAWGPEGHWWSNATRAARLAFWFGTPATALLVYFQLQDFYTQEQALYGPTGLPDFIANLILYQLAWGAAGFTLGALWRLLPGRRSQARAWVLTIAYGIPGLMAAAVIKLTDEDPGQLILYTVLLLSVLTLTSIWMDMATFREERQYWASPFALLVSIYQLRGLSGQIAWLLVQLVAAATLYRNLKH